MKVVEKKLEDGMIELQIQALPEEVDRAFQLAEMSFAQRMGLQPQQGKTLEQACVEQLGIKNLTAVVAPEVLDNLVPFALDKRNIIPAYPPHVRSSQTPQRAAALLFVATVAPKPEYELASYDPVAITVPPFTVDQHAVSDLLAQLADQHAEYVTDSPRPVKAGDSCLLQLECFEGSTKLEGLSVDARTYTAGEGFMPDGFDQNIIGMQPGETKTFTFEGPGFDDAGNNVVDVVTCTATVKEIQKRCIPELTDAWVAQHLPPFKTVEELRAQMVARVEAQGRERYDEYRRQMAVARLADRFQGCIADPVYEAMRDNLVENLQGQLKQQGLTYEDYVEQQGGQQQFSMALMLETRAMLVQGYALDALYRHEHLSATDADIEAVCRAMNPQQDPRQTRQQMEWSGRGFVLRESAQRLHANQWLLDHADIQVETPVSEQ